MEIPLVPVAMLLHRGAWPAGARNVLDIVAIDRDQATSPLVPQSGSYTSGTSAPVVADQYCVVDGKPVHEVAQIGAERCLLARSRRRRVAETGRPKPTQPRHEYATAVGGKLWPDLSIITRVGRPAVQEDHGPAVSRSILLVSDLECRSANYVHCTFPVAAGTERVTR